MQIVTEISKEDYNAIIKQVADGITNPLKISITNGIPIPDNATNGDVIKAMFGNNVFAEDEYEDEDGMTWIDMISDNGMTFEMDWWNAPYQKGEDDNE